MPQIFTDSHYKFTVSKQVRPLIINEHGYTVQLYEVFAISIRFKDGLCVWSNFVDWRIYRAFCLGQSFFGEYAPTEIEMLERTLKWGERLARQEALAKLELKHAKLAEHLKGVSYGE